MKFKIATPFSEQEIGNDDLCWVDYDGKRIQVSKIDCFGLERLATWNAIHIEQRSRDHYDRNLICIFSKKTPWPRFIIAFVA